MDVCSICTSPIRPELEAALDKREPLRSIAARSGYSRASLSRHNRRCRGRQAIAEYKTHGTYDPFSHRIWLKWGDAEPYLDSDIQRLRSWDVGRRPVRPEEIVDVIFHIVYADACPESTALPKESPDSQNIP